MSAAVQAKRARAKSALRIIQLFAAYHFYTAGAKLFEWPFWFFEQRRGWFADRIDNQRSAQ